MAITILKNLLPTAVILSFLLVAISGCGSTTPSASSLYEDAENGLSKNWKVIRGDSSPERIYANNGSQFCINLPVQWINNGDGTWHNPHEYHLTLLNNSDEFFLHVDVGGTGMEVPHYVLGVKIDTDMGARTLTWDAFYNHENIDAKITYHDDNDATLNFPSPIELVRGFGFSDTTLWEHFEVDIEAYLHQFEPTNSVVRVHTFLATGGNLDNIRLSSH